MKRFFSTLRYSFGNEDWKTEREALNLKENDTVLCITASGDRPLNLLLNDCQRIQCVDANPAQNHLLDLKAQAMKYMDYSSYLAFLGALPCENRAEILHTLLPHLTPASAMFWKKHAKMIEKGIIYQGRVERLTTLLAYLFSWMRGKKVNRLFSFENLEEQRKFVKEEWESALLKSIFGFFLNSSLRKMIIEDPGLENTAVEIKQGTYIYERHIKSLERELAKKNPLLSLLLKGKVSKEAYAPYMTEEGTRVIKDKIDALSVHTGDVLKYLESISKPTFDAFSLSDVSSYLSHADFVRLLRGMIQTAKPGAKFCLRQFMTAHEMPHDLKPYFVRNTALEKKCEENDSCFLYRFMIGTLDVPR